MSKFCPKTSGRVARLYYKTGTGDGAEMTNTASLVEITEAKDITLTINGDESVSEDRGTVFKEYQKGNIELGITFDMVYRNGSVNAKFIKDMILESPACAYQFWLIYGDVSELISGAGSTSEVDAYVIGCQVFTDDMSFPLNGETVKSVTLKPSYFRDTIDDVDVPPQFIDVGDIVADVS